VTARCPLCTKAGGEPFYRDARRPYLRCTRCQLIFVPPHAHLRRGEEFAQYLLHENAVHDAGYRRFLSRLAAPLLARLPAPASGLDFGCGPAPALAVLLAEHGHRVELHDSFFCPNPRALSRRYDFITASEVVEHLYAPGTVLAQLWDCLRPGGWLAVMTKLARDRDAFEGWHYRRDPTHVCFFSRESWRWWGQQYGAVPLFHGEDVILLQREGRPQG
jgi:SAM-dependent methyltransferase